MAVTHSPHPLPIDFMIWSTGRKKGKQKERREAEKEMQKGGRESRYDRRANSRFPLLREPESEDGSRRKRKINH
jgi:hypothetical protein